MALENMHTLVVKLTDEEWEAMKEKSEKEMRRASSQARWLVLNWINEQPQLINPDTDPLEGDD